MSQAHEIPQIPDTPEGLFEAIDSAWAQVDEKQQLVTAWAEALLGSDDDETTARGRIRLLTNAMELKPSERFATDIPLESLRTDRDMAKNAEDRMTALAVNEHILDTLYEENGVDVRQRELYDDEIGGFTMREIIYPTDNGYAFIEHHTFAYGDNPETSMPIRLDVQVHSLRYGQPTGLIFLVPKTPASNE